MASLPPALNVFVIARQNETWIEPASVAVLIGTFASVLTLTSVMWALQSGRLVFPCHECLDASSQTRPRVRSEAALRRASLSQR
jgi:hypothetical protein